MDVQCICGLASVHSPHEGDHEHNISHRRSIFNRDLAQRNPQNNFRMLHSLQPTTPNTATQERKHQFVLGDFSLRWMLHERSMTHAREQLGSLDSKYCDFAKTTYDGTSGKRFLDAMVPTGKTMHAASVG